MGIIYLLFGLLIGTQASRIFKKESRSNNNKDSTGEIHIDENTENTSGKNGTKKYRVHKKMKKYFTLNSNNPDGIDPEKVKVEITEKSPERNKSSPNNSFIPLTILWAHFISKQLGLLKEEHPAPWDLSYSDKDKDKNIDSGINISSNSWKDFLSNIVSDKNWFSWIKDPDEVKKRTLLAFQN